MGVSSVEMGGETDNVSVVKHKLVRAISGDSTQTRTYPSGHCSNGEVGVIEKRCFG